MVVRSLSILVTRPSPQGEQLCRLLIQRGHLAFHCPTIAFAPPADWEAVGAMLPLVNQQDWLIFNSPQAVMFYQKYMSSLPPPSSRGLSAGPTSNATLTVGPADKPRDDGVASIAAIGAGTARALKEAGFSSVISPPSNWNSEGLLALPEFQAIQNKRIMIVRGEGGREALEPALCARGAEVRSLIVYQRILPSLNIDPFIRLLAAQKIDAIVATSCTGVEHLKVLFAPVWHLVVRVSLVVISERIKRLAEGLGFQSIWICSPDEIAQQFHPGGIKRNT